ncbi:hypothetical protein GF068_28500 [Polyangium spumosum]|uniref:Uncharacterized protein n=2 Tax=Polyangium spumosum TaxID=889282 RepID=A0A6N7PV92_9BACT|nr:hypothetical protein [Polyangium spumosum]
MQRVEALSRALRQAEQEAEALSIQKDAFAAEARALRDELERRKKAAEQAAAAEGKPLPTQKPKARPSKPPEPITAFFCLICGEGSNGAKPHRCLVEEEEQRKKVAMGRK